MELNVLDTEEKIKNAKFKNADELIQAYYFYMKQNYVSEELHEYLMEKHTDLNITFADFLIGVKDYGDIFKRKIDIFSDKIIKNSFIRRFVKNLSKELGNGMSQTKMTKWISITLSLTASNISDICYQLCFDEETMFNLIELISDDNILKKEFEVTINRLVMDISLHMNDDYDFEHCFANILSRFYCDYYYNDRINFNKLKMEMNDFLNMSNEEIRLFYNNINEKQDQIQKKYDQGKQEIIDETIDKLTEKILPRVREQGIELSNQEGREHIRALLEGDSEDSEEQFDLGKKIFDRTKDTINKYYLYEEEMDEEFLNESFIKTTRAYIHKNEEPKKNFFQMCAIYLSECFKKYEVNFIDEDTENKIYQFLITRDFMLFLAHHLLDGQVSFKQELLEISQNILNTNLIAANNYTDFINSFDIAPHVLAYTPTQLNDCIIVMSVLKEINDDKSIMRKIRRLLIKYYKDVNDNLPMVNMKEQESYFEDNSNLCVNERLHSYAVTFMFNYFKDPVYIAPLSAFIYEFEDIMEDSNQFYHYDESMIKRIGIESKIKDNEILKKAYDYYNEINQLMDRLDELDIEEIKDVVVIKYTLLFISSIQKNNIYDNFFDCGYMIKKYQKNLAFILSFESNQISHGFDERYDEEKVELLWELAIQISLIKEIYKSYKLIPKTQDLSKDDYTHLLEKTNEDFKEQLRTKDTENLVLKNQIKSLNQIIQSSNNTKSNEIEKNYNREIHNLNKTIAVQEKRIKELEENQEELYKLRSLMFDLENQEDINIKENINYGELLLEISNDKKIVFVGGHIKLLDILKEKYPNMIFIGNRNTISTHLINNADYVFFFYNFLNHGLYYKIMGMINSNPHIKWDYISSKNINLVEKDIYKKLRNYETDK